MPETAKSADGRTQRWRLAPGGRDLGRVWVTVVFATLTVAGVFVVTVFGLRAARMDAERAERADIAADGAIFLSRTILALQAERGLAELWHTHPSPEIRTAYREAQGDTDESIETMKLAWQVRRTVMDSVGPPTLADVEDGLVPLSELRDAILRMREGSSVSAYSGVIDVVIAANRRMEVVAVGSPLSPNVRGLVRIVDAEEALARQRDVVVAAVGGEAGVSRDDLIRLLLLQQEARTNLASIRLLGVEAVRTQVDEFLSAMGSDPAQGMLTQLQSGEGAVDPLVWYAAASDRLNRLESIMDRVADALATDADDLVEAAESAIVGRTIGLLALLSVSVIAGAAAITAARHRAKALGEHGELAASLLQWFLPERMTEVGGVQVAARYDAASEYTRAGGDWYDVYRTPDGRVAMTIGDVAGHGAAATAQMAQARNLLRGIALTSDGSPAAHLTALDAILRGSGTMATVFHALLDVERGELVYVRAGHLAGLVRTAGTVAMLDGALGSPVGVESRGPYEDTAYRLSSPSEIVVFTDGLVEERDADLEAGLAAVTAWLRDAPWDPDVVADELIGTRPVRLDDAALLIVAWEAGSTRGDGRSVREAVGSRAPGP